MDPLRLSILFRVVFRCLKYIMKIRFIILEFSNFFHELFTTLPLQLQAFLDTFE